MAGAQAALDRTLIARAVKLAERGWGNVEPNPYVGAVLARGSRILAEGAHLTYGGPHAEVAVLRKAGKAARGATLYVTLEPCSHQGKTPPCDRLILESGVKRVVVGWMDPNPRACGGLQNLEAAGVAVTCLEDEASKTLVSPFRNYLSERRPFVLAKWAMTMDGRIAARGGDSRYITSPLARARVHRERARSDAVLIGSSTLLVDDPDLTARLAPGRSGIRVVLDRRLRTPLRARLVHTAREVPTWILTGPFPDPAHARSLEKAGVRIFPLARHATLSGALRTLRGNGVHRILSEGGAAVLGALLRARAVDRVQVFVAPRILGGSDALGPVGGRGPGRMALAKNLLGMRTRKVGPDLLIEGDPEYRSWGRRAGIIR